jgi:NitT/TauT family transport system substrate-binding protein
VKRTAFATGALAVCFVAPARAQQTAAPLPVVRVAMPPVDAASQAYYALDKGFFKKAGLSVEILTVSGGGPIAAAVAGGAADIGQSNLSTICSAHERNLPFVAVAGSNLFVAKTHQSQLVVAPNAPIHEAKDLNGKTLGVAGLKNITEVAFDLWMDTHGGSYQSVKVLEVPFASMADAVATGRVDAVMMTEPELSGALEKKRVRILAAPMESIGREFLVGVWFATSSYAKSHPEIVRAFAAAMADAANWANRNQSESAKILEAHTGVPLGANAARVLFANRLDVKQIQPVIDASAKYGALKAPFPASQLLAND